MHLVFSLNLKKENIHTQPISKSNAFDCIMGSSRKVPDMIPCLNFELSEIKKYQPLQESFNNFNSIITGMSLGHRYNEHDCEYSTKVQGNFGDKSRQKGFGHTFQLEFASLCVKVIPHFKILNLGGVKIPGFVFDCTVVRKSHEKILMYYFYTMRL